MFKLATIAIIAFVSLPSLAQCNDPFFLFQEGASFELSNYSAKGKELGKSINKVTDISGADATVTSTTKGDGDETFEFSYHVICENNTIKMDFASFMGGLAKQYGEADISVEGDFMAFPNTLEVGQELSNSNGVIKVKIAEPTTMEVKMTMRIIDRKVEKKESITTPAGTYETYKITQKTVTENEMMGRKMSAESKSITWIAKNIGTIKAETYDQNGKMLGYTLLTSLAK